MGLLDIQEARAAARARAAGLAEVVACERDRPPIRLASPGALEDRKRFLTRTQGAEGARDYERILAGDELQPVNYLPRGEVAARPVCRLVLRDAAGRLAGYATGFLVAPQVLLTNNHVFPSAASAATSTAEFDYELDVLGRDKPVARFALAPQRLFHTVEALDFSIVAVETASRDGAMTLGACGFLPLIGATGKVAEGEWLTIVQHPKGERKELCIRENQLLKRTDDMLWYSTDTEPGSSGSPVFNNDWQVVALHHAGVPDPSGAADVYIANEGVRVSRIVDTLRAALPGEALLEPVFNMDPARAQALVDGFATAAATAPSGAASAPVTPRPPTVAGAPPPPLPPPEPLPSLPKEAAMRTVTLTLDIAADGAVSVRQAGGSRAGAIEAARPAAAPRRRSAPVDYGIDFDTDYTPEGARRGYQPDYLGAGSEVAAPRLGPDLQSLATRLIDAQGKSTDKVELKYRGYSVVMHSTRKFAIWTAANVDGGDRYRLSRPHDEWRFDPRIPRAAQIGGYYYASNQFDRGHLTRYEDMEYGASVQEALRSAADTLHFTNCTPQHARFNEGKPLWQGLETHILEDSIKANAFRAAIFTGPVLDEGDPAWDRYKDVQYPLKFWKVAVAPTSAGKLFAAGFVLDQSGVIAQYGIESTVEAPFTAFKTFQVPIAEIERLTGLTFWCGAGGETSLSTVDPLSAASPARRRLAATATAAPTESTLVADLRPGYVPLEDGGDIVRG